VLCVNAGALDEPLMTATVGNIAAKKKVTVPNYDFVTHCRSQFIAFAQSTEIKDCHIVNFFCSFHH